MGKFPREDIKRAVLFAVICYLTLNFRPKFDSLKTDHAWLDWQIDLLVMGISSVTIFIVYSLLFARPTMTVRWVAENDYAEQSESLPIPRTSRRPKQFVLIIDMTADSALGVLVIKAVRALGLQPIVRLGSPSYVRMVAERNGTSYTQPGPQGYWGVRAKWEATLSSGALQVRSMCSFPTDRDEIIAGSKHEMTYELERRPAPAGRGAWFVRACCWLVKRFVRVQAMVRHIYVQ